MRERVIKMSVLLDIHNLKKYFKTPNGLLHAVENVSFSIEEGKTFGLVGESGCGKSTLGRIVVGLLEATDGEVIFEGKNIAALRKKEKIALRRRMQIIFQDPVSSLDPRMCVSELIAEPLRSYKEFSSKDNLYSRIGELMDTVGLARRLTYSYPHELDGGRRQRIGIARALALNPKFIVCDEPVSALDVSIQAQILNLLQELQEAHGLTYIFITHDLSVVKHISDDIMVMYLGCVVEKAESNELFEKQLHPYTKGLISAIPIPSIHREKLKIMLKGELASPINPKPGCRFASRCPYSKPDCEESQPKLKEIFPGHFVACHYAGEINNI